MYIGFLTKQYGRPAFPGAVQWLPGRLRLNPVVAAERYKREKAHDNSDTDGLEHLIATMSDDLLAVKTSPSHICRQNRMLRLLAVEVRRLSGAPETVLESGYCGTP